MTPHMGTGHMWVPGPHAVGHGRGDARSRARVLQRKVGSVSGPAGWVVSTGCQPGLGG